MCDPVDDPPATTVTHEIDPATVVGDGEFVVDPSPSWPLALSPQHVAIPATEKVDDAVTAHVWRYPAERP
ncbi:MAG: hypothetical protein EB145_10865 [Proteobacteria bacterium]|nr:hypothetical protein [Pseudomonadota bacterium]